MTVLRTAHDPSELIRAYGIDPRDVQADGVRLDVMPSLTQRTRTTLRIAKIIQERVVHIVIDHDGNPLEVAPSDSVPHDHSREPRVWCETHQHEHIASIPRFTYLCKACGFGGWYTPDAEQHELDCPGHETYEVEHRVRPLRPAQSDERDADWFLNGWKAAVREAKVRHDAGQIGDFLAEHHRVISGEESK